MRSFKDIFEQQGRKEFLENRPQTPQEIDAARKKLAKIPVLSDDEMRAQNPGATAAYEKDAAERKGRKKGSTVRTVRTPEGSIVTNMPSGSSTPEEILARLENKPSSTSTSATSRPSTGSKPKFRSNTQRKPVVTPAPTTPKPQNINLGDTSLPKTPKAPKVTPLSVSTPKPTSTMTPSSIGKAFDQVLQNREARKAAEKAKGALKFAKAVKGAGTALSVIGSGIEAKGGYDTARKEGASKKRALGAGVARGLGSFIGGGVGAAAGSVLGLPGAIAGGAAGYSLGTNVGTAAYKAVTGDPLKKLTTKSVLTNVRKAVPYEVRKQVPAGARKAFRDFVTQAGKSYGNWSRSQQQGGNK